MGTPPFTESAVSHSVFPNLHVIPAFYYQPMHYIGPVNPNLICCICRAPFIEPTTTKHCSHTFCKDCITQALEVTPQCPVDRSSLSEDGLCPANPIIRHLVDELEVECPQRSHGCSHICQRQWIHTHIEEDCQFVTVRCCQEQCDMKVLRKDAIKHSSTCGYRVVQCEACGARIQFIELEEHHAKCPAEEVTCPHCTSVLHRGEMFSHSATCPNCIIGCDHAAHGCSWTGPRSALASSHLAQCPYEAIKGFLVFNSNRLSVLEAENTQLKGRVKDLESSLRSAKLDLEIARNSLGPWFRPDGCQTSSRPPPPPSEPAPRLYQRRRLSNALSSAMFPFPTDPSSPAEATSAQPGLRPRSVALPPDSLAQFFPPSESSVSQSQSVSTPSDGTMTTVDGVHPRCTINSSVAPINLNTTLEGSLASLRNSIVTLAASLDSESRRHDIALTTDSLRVNEEVGSLRAIVHGLRMQVHQIMMDRNSQITVRQDEDGGGYFRPSNFEPWTSSVRYLNHHPPLHRPISIGHTTTTQIQSTKL